MPLGADDITAIHQLYSAYCLAADDGDGAAYSSCFTPDGSVGGMGRPVSGHERLAKLGAGFSVTTPGVRHVVVNVHADGDGDEAQGRAYLIAYAAGAGGSKLLTTGRYRDRLRRIDGRWLFAERLFTPDSAGTPPPS